MSWNFPLLFFLLLIPLSGFIAWAGDRIGHRIGKRRHTFFGLRPRHTATVTTIAAGMVIALVSFGLMWASNATFRKILSEGAQMLSLNQSLTARNQALAAGIEEQKTLAAQAKAEVETRLEEANAARAQEARAKDSLEKAADDLRAARNSLSTTKAQLRAKEERVREAQEAVAEATTRRERAEGAAERAQVAAATAQRQVDSAERSIKEAGKLFKETTARQNSEMAELTRKRQELENLIQQLEARRQQENLEFGLSLALTADLRRGSITYEVNEELDRVSLPTGLSIEQAQKALWGLLARAAERASERGAASGPNGRSVFILPKPVRTGDAAQAAGGASDRVMDEADSVTAAAEAIHQADESVAVVVMASANAVEKEPVPVEFRTYRNRQVLKRDAEVGRITIDGSKPQPEVADRLYTFLRRDIRRGLLEKGIIPPSPDTRGSGDVVSLSGDRWFRLLDEVRRAGSPVQVVVRAAADLRAADPVALDFEVEPMVDVSER